MSTSNAGESLDWPLVSDGVLERREYQWQLAEAASADHDFWNPERRRADASLNTRGVLQFLDDRAGESE